MSVTVSACRPLSAPSFTLNAANNMSYYAYFAVRFFSYCIFYFYFFFCGSNSIQKGYAA